MTYLAALWLLAAAQTRTAAPAAFERVAQEAAQARGQNRIEEAIRLYRQAVSMRPSWPEGWWFLGELLYEQDKYTDARDAVRRLIVLDPKSGPGFALLGLCEYETHEYKQALADINEGRRLGLGEDPQVKRVVLYHAVLLFTRFGMFESARQVLEMVVKLGGTGRAVIDAAGLAGLRRPALPEEMRPDEQELVELAGRAVCAVAEDHAAEARNYFNELLAKYPATPNVHYLYGTFLQAKDRDAAIAEFQKELELNARHKEALVTLALEYEQQGDVDRALSYAQRAVDAAPQFFAAHLVRGRLFSNAGESEKGIQELEIARKQAPDSPQVHFALAAAYSIAGRKEDAARERAEFLRLKQMADETTGRDTVAHP